MPKLTYTAAKGLVQETGTGMSLKGDMDGQKHARKSVTATAALSTEDSGKIITLTGTAFTLSLPPVATGAGCHFKVLVGEASQAYAIQEDSGDNNVLTLIGANTSTSQRDDAFTKATVASSADSIGDRFHIRCNGTYWVITSFTNAAVTTA